MRIAFALECCDREAVGHIATTEGIKREDVRDLMGRGRRTALRTNQSTAGDDRMADRQRLLLHCWRNTHVCSRDRLRAADDPWKANNRMEWPRLSYTRSNVTMSASIRHPMRKPSSDRCRNGSTTTTNFTRIARWVIVSRVSSLPIGQSKRLWSPCPEIKARQHRVDHRLIFDFGAASFVIQMLRGFSIGRD